MTKKRLLFMDILSGTAAFMLFLSLSIFPAFLLLRHPYTIVFFIIPYALCFIMRRGIRHLSVFLLPHLALPLSIFLLNVDLYQRLAYFALMLAVVIHSLYRRLTRSAVTVSVSFVVFQTVCAGAFAVIAGRYGHAAAGFIQPFTVAVVFLCYIIFQHINNLDETLELITRTTTQPVHAILFVNSRIIAVFAVIAAIAAALFSFVRLDSVIALLGRGFLALLRFLLSLLNGKGSSAQPEPQPPMPVQQGMPPFMPVQPEAKPWLIWVILDKIFYYLAIIAPFALAAALIIFLCLRLYRRFYERVKTNDEVESIPHDNLAMEAVKAIRLFFIPLSGVRRHFYKKIKRYMGKGVPIKASDTPEEMTAKIAEEDISRLTEAYQEARYK